MKITYLLLLIGSIMAASDNYFYDIYYDKEYEIDMNKFAPYNYMPPNANYYFRVAVKEEELIQLQLKVLKGAIIGFRVNICGFVDRPDDIQVLTAHDNCYNHIIGKLDHSENGKDVYLYDFEATKGLNYLVIHLETNNSLYYLSINITPN